VCGFQPSLRDEVHLWDFTRRWKRRAIIGRPSGTNWPSFAETAHEYLASEPLRRSWCQTLQLDIVQIHSMDGNRSDAFWTARSGQLRVLHEILFAANITLAFGNALILCLFRENAIYAPKTDAEYYFLRGVVRISDLLHFGATNPVSTNGVARGGHPLLWNLFAINITFLGSLSAAAILVLLLIRVMNRSSSFRAAFRHAPGIVGLLVAPACCFWGLDLRGGNDVSGAPFPKFLFYVLAAEIIGFLGLFVVTRRQQIAAWVSALLLILHYGFWCLVLFVSLPIEGALRRPALFFLYLLPVSLWLISSAGAACLLYVIPGSNTSVFDTSVGIGKWMLSLSLLAMVTLLSIWLPRRSFPLTSPKDLKAATIEMSRGPCYGMCPSYRITIHGDGSVEYAGGRLARRDPQIGNIGPDGFSRILDDLRQAHFSTLEDRAFSWCFDSGSVSISVSLEGKAKRVVSDAGCTGSKTGMQSQFVAVADKIDKAVGSDRWIRCTGGFCRE
jgi:hypothetical protein